MKIFRYSATLLTGSCLALWVEHSFGESAAPGATAIASTVESFHKALVPVPPIK